MTKMMMMECENDECITHANAMSHVFIVVSFLYWFGNKVSGEQFEGFGEAGNTDNSKKYKNSDIKLATTME
jgi:hypothetical protein